MQQINLNKNWEFRREAQSPWEAVSLPHTPRLEALEVSRPFQGVVSYRKRFQARQAWANCRVALRFEGAMQSARVLINGRQAAEHAGGYLPLWWRSTRFYRLARRISSRLRSIIATIRPFRPASRRMAWIFYIMAGYTEMLR